MAAEDKQRKLAPAVGGPKEEEASGAGGGALGFFGFLALTALALMFFVAESFFLAMLLMSFALLMYVAGAEILELMRSAVTVFFSQKHLHEAVHIQKTVVALRRHLRMKKDADGVVRAGLIEKGTKVKLPDNPLVREIQAVLKRERGAEYAEYVGHQYYVRCRELYDHLHAHLEFVAGVMPLLGLVGTVVGLIGMFDKLGPIGLTSFMQEVTRVRAIEGELARTIQAMKSIKAARVHIVLPETGSFRRGRQPASAAVFIRTEGAANNTMTQAIRHLVSAAVPGFRSTM